MDIFDFLNQLLMDLFLAWYAARFSESSIELLFVGDAIPGSINAM